MRKQQRSFLFFLDVTIDAINNILEYIGEMNFEEFSYDKKTVDAVIRNFEVIGEAAKNVPAGIKLKYSEVPWKEMYLLRNKVSHEYFGVDHELLFDLGTNSIEENRSQILKIIKSEKEI